MIVEEQGIGFRTGVRFPSAPLLKNRVFTRNNVFTRFFTTMYTDPTHLKVSDPGKLEGNTVFTYLDAFCKPEHFGRYLPDYPNLDELKAHYTRGGLGDMKVKKFLAAIMQEELTPIRERRKEFEKDIPAIYDMLRKGCETARATATATLDEVRKAMKINYFDDVELIAEQAKRFGQE